MTSGLQFVPERVRQHLIHAFAWVAACAALFNACLFVWLTANPVLRSDEWYSLDIFVRKAVAGQLGAIDFFTRRYAADHAQPLNKLVMLIEWRWFGLDSSVGAVIGVMAATACAVILHRVVLPTQQREQRGVARRCLAWAVICALLFSLNASVIWTWPLATLGYLAVLPILLFLLATWQAWQHRRYLTVALATLLLGVVADDSAVITVVATLVALLLFAFREPTSSRAALWKTTLVILACMVLVRIGYSLVPLLDNSMPNPSLSARLTALYGQLRAGGAWQWLTTPLALSVAHDNPFHGLSTTGWNKLQMVVAVGLLAAHAVFWRRALLGGYSKLTFIAVCLMLLSYGWLAAILVVRVSYFGSDYLAQDRYVEFYQFNLIALLLMWADTSPLADRGASWRNWLTGHLPATACGLLLLLQIPLAQAAWQQRRYVLPYYGQMATQIEQMSADPARTEGCLPLLVVCQWPLERRRAALELLRDQRLNVFSSRVQAQHRFLPRWPVNAEGRAQ
ncbi:hypothetical protein IHE49_12435 [Rhodanobacter sp. 7MK24]|uniref:hypothetical protein n=1 Tax=Rhodanobacter sp. 7MK24 TaxID=2775922 RepID=UPI001785A1B1|nr:hypothetical protein [Rhodanobacter sp. 7MK24]MBD8881290.1 hypothetical protein [Rhodanobacter sp. 7MK24]